MAKEIIILNKKIINLFRRIKVTVISHISFWKASSCGNNKTTYSGKKKMSHSDNEKTTCLGELPWADILERVVIRNRYHGDISGDNFVAKGDSFSNYRQQKLSGGLLA